MISYYITPEAAFEDPEDGDMIILMARILEQPTPYDPPVRKERIQLRMEYADVSKTVQILMNGIVQQD